MKAAVLKAFGSPLAIETLPDPILGTGEVIVDVMAASVVSYANEAFSGARNYLLDLPLAPGIGAVGRVRAVGPDATRLAAGDWVACDPTVRSRDDALSPDILLQGWTAGGEGGLRLQAHFRHGPFAERIMIPTENAVRLGAIDTADAARWCALNTLLVPYGGLLAANLQAGETILISGATGNFGSAGVALALAMGAACVIAPGRNEEALEDLTRRFGRRVRAVKLLGSEEDDRKRMLQAAPGPIDRVLDLLPPSAPAAAVRAAAMTVRPHGTIVLMGGVAVGLELPYRHLMRNCITLRGQWMFPREAAVRLVGLIRSGLVTLDHWDITEFGLDRVNEAVAHAAANGGPFKMTVIRP
ncbi:alcohol dehydrogenase [Sorangium cellulosum]|uniref:Alcohol dehydrogenase n=1 Tax=Sorangium cellulosum TaxID=56 RepID=A0A2L0F426_SORCE|nr:zinc-binding alcohol dehydrogenase family protein [Sorangium cellulosum]AUX46320.1 alcohol dehydrogenase [Sorangium cellulosum]